MASVPNPGTDLRRYYDQVIDTHKNLAVVLLNVACTVVDGRIPHHDLPKMLRDLAEREEVMAVNWTLVRDGLFDKLNNDTVSEIADLSVTMDLNEDGDRNQPQDQIKYKGKLYCSENYQVGGQPMPSRSDRAQPIWQAKRQAARERRIQKSARNKALPEEERILNSSQIRKINEALMLTQQELKSSKNMTPEEVTRALRTRDELESTLQQQNMLRQLEGGKQQDRNVKQLAGRSRQSASQRPNHPKKQEKQAESIAQRVKRRHNNEERVSGFIATRMERDVAEVPGERALSFLPPRQQLWPLFYEVGDLTIKEEVIEPWEI